MCLVHIAKVERSIMLEKLVGKVNTLLSPDDNLNMMKMEI